MKRHARLSRALSALFATAALACAVPSPEEGEARAVDVWEPGGASVAAASVGASNSPAGGPSSFVGLREAEARLKARLDTMRRRQGARPLDLSPLYREVAGDALRDAIGEGRVEEAGSADAISNRLEARGAVPRLVVVSVLRAVGDPRLVIDRWVEESPQSFEGFIDGEVREFTLVADLSLSPPLYVAVGGQSQADALRPSVEALQDLDGVRADVWRRTNRERTRRGLEPLVYSGRLETAAQAHARDMVQRRYFAHDSPDGRDVADRVMAAGYDRLRLAAENLASGQETAEEAMDGWMRSPGHRANILRPDARELGVGLAVAERSDGAYDFLWVQVFGARHPER